MSNNTANGGSDNGERDDGLRIFGRITAQEYDPADLALPDGMINKTKQGNTDQSECDD